MQILFGSLSMFRMHGGKVNGSDVAVQWWSRYTTCFGDRKTFSMRMDAVGLTGLPVLVRISGGDFNPS